MSELDAGEDLFDDFLNSRLEDDENIDQQLSVGDAINDDEFEKLLNESETEIVQNEPEKEPISLVDSSNNNNINTSTTASPSTIKKEQGNEDNDEEVIEFSWTDEDYNKDETDQVNQNNLISEIKIQQEQVTNNEKSEKKEVDSTTSASSNDQQESIKSQEIIETRISVMISDVLNKFGKVIDIDSRSDAIQNRIKTLKDEDTDSEYSFGKLKSSVQRKLVVLECALDNLCVLVEKNVQRKLKLRESKKVLQEQLRTSIERYSEKCTLLDDQKEKYSKMETLWERDRKNLVDIIEKLKEQVESKDPENEYLKSMKIPEAPKETDSIEDNTLSNLTKSLLSLPDTWKASNTTDSNPPSSNTTSSSSSTSSEPNKVDPLAKASSWLSSWMK